MAGTPNPLGSPLPLAAAPMAGGPTTVRLAAAVSEAGAFAFLAGGYQSADALAADIAELRRSTEAFGVNLFAPNVARISEADYRRYAEELRADAERYGLDLSQAPLVQDEDRWQDKLDLLVADPVPVVSLTFGLARPAEISALRLAGSRVLITVTTVDEARAAAAGGADALFAQGSDAGGHNGTHDPLRQITPTRTDDLTRALIAATGLPVVAAGGVDGPETVAALLDAGAGAVAVGTLLLRTDESGASRTYQDALADPAFTETVLTRAFTGRYARALRNRFVDEHDAAAPTGYPAVHYLTRGLRRAAAAAGDPHRVHLWAGTGYRNAATGPARAVVDRLAGGL
ncbi:nitronate monooxygenase [Jatrophihabitans sp.]|jgi:NAD(P)H-dependent flavin oxidoreductase YrpB (nitropropane dioxygenase family)|uniref:nitronate monooxygenase n=1 Tax=Jatrophihabitans sp. TaxID=1932789 RepID=UPI002F23BA07